MPVRIDDKIEGVVSLLKETKSYKGVNRLNKTVRFYTKDLRMTELSHQEIMSGDLSKLNKYLPI